MMKKDHKIENIIKPLVVGICLLLTGCGTIGIAREATFESAYENTPEQEEPAADVFISSARGVVETVDQEAGTITVYLLDRREERTFHYDAATVVEDKYGSALTMVQLMPGEITDITYNDELEKAGSVKASADAWNYDDMVKYNLNLGNSSASIGDSTYRIDEHIKVFSENKQIELNQILNQDVLTFRGIGHNIVSIVVEKGHGYLDLINDEAVQGGWIEVGQAVIQQISPETFLTVPEGSYKVRLTANGIEEAREVTIKRNQEAVLDLGDIEVKQPENGKVVFTVTPDTATVFVDDVEIDASRTVLLPFGLHQVTASASGYDKLSQYVNVEGEKTTVKIALEETVEVTVSGNSSQSEGNNTITIEAPGGAEVYQDNLYMGFAPVTYKKTAGSHTITLRKTGYISKSYTIEVQDDGRDVKYSFPDLEPESNAVTVSGNNSTVSGNSSNDGDKTTTVSGNSSTVSGNNGTVSGNN